MITYTDSLANITPDMLNGGFFVGWPNSPDAETHLRVLHGSYKIWLALDNVKVVGFINAVSDGVLSAYIPLLEVLPEYQEQRIGTELTQRMLNSLNHLYMIDLLCDENLQPYYHRLGMHPATGMLIRNYDKQSGGKMS